MLKELQWGGLVTNQVWGQRREFQHSTQACRSSNSGELAMWAWACGRRGWAREPWV